MMRWRALPSCAATVLLAACTGEFATVAPIPPPQFVTTGETSGSACGVLLFDVIPIKYNDRVARAYRQAVESAGAEGLTDTTITDRWYFIYAGGLYCTDVRGMGFRASAPAAHPAIGLP